MTKEVIHDEETKNHSPEFKAKVALEAIREEMTLAELSKNICYAPWVPIPRGDHGLVQPQGACLAVVKQYGCRLLRGGFERSFRQTR